MIRRPPRSTLDRSSAASDVYKRQGAPRDLRDLLEGALRCAQVAAVEAEIGIDHSDEREVGEVIAPVSYTHLRAHETVLDLVCRLLLEKKNK